MRTSSIIPIEEQDKINFWIINRLDQLKQDAANQPFNPEPIIINPNPTAILKRAENNLDLSKLEKPFQSSFQLPSKRAGALNPRELITENTFSILYQIISGGSFDRGEALNLLEFAIGIQASSLSDDQIRGEFLTLIHMASLSGSSEARFLESVAKTKQQGKKLETVSEIKTKIDDLKIARDQEEEAGANYRNARGVKDAKEVEWKPLADQYRKSSLLRQELEHNLNNYFSDIKNSDQEEHKIVETNIQSGASKPIPGSKQPIIPEASADIIAADLPLAGVASEDPLKNPLFNQTQLSQVLTIKTLNRTQTDKIASEAKLLQDSLGRSDNKAVQILKGQIGVRAEDVQKTKRFYENIDWNKFKAPDISAQKSQLQSLHDNSLLLGQRYASDLEGGAFNRVLHLADIGKQINMNDLIYVLMKRNLLALYNTQGSLKLDELNKLYQNLIRYLMLSTYLDHVGRFQGSIQIANAACSKNTQTDDCQIKLGNAVLLATSIRNYAISAHIEYLVFEYFMKILIRPEQVKALDSLQIKDSQIKNQKALGGLLELIMGAGKTSVLLPLLSVLDNSGEWLNLVVLPESLIASMSVELSKQLSSSFSRGVIVMNISRQRYLYEQDLKLLYDRLSQARSQNQTVVTTNSAIQSLFLSFIDRLARYEKEPHQVSAEIEQFKKIFIFLRQYGRLTIDEVDLALDILQAHQFSVGSPKPLINNPILKTIPVVAFSLYREISTNRKLNQELDFPFLHHRGHTAFTAGSYRDFKSKLIDAILKPQFLNISEDLGRVYNQNIGTLKNLAKTYLLSNKLGDRTALFSQIGDPRLKDVFAVLYDEINHVLPLTAVRKVGVHYGSLVEPIRKTSESQANFDNRMLTYKNSKLIAIPYHSGEPMVNSRFGTPLEALNYTLQLALHQQGYRDTIEQEIKSLKKMVFENSANLTNGIFAKRLENLTGPGVKLNIMHITAHDIERLTHRLRTAHQIREQLELDWLYAIPQVRFNDIQLTTNAQIYESLFAFIQGFSGTLWSSQTFPKIFQKPIQSNTPQKTFFIVWQDYLEHKKPLLVLADTPSYLSQIYSGQFRGSLMDEAGIFRGHSNLELAQKIKEETGNHVAFYDDTNNLVSCCDQTNHAMVLKNKAPENNLVAFWDKKHTTGSDIKLLPDMTAAMTIDFHITSRSFQQTVWRLRGLGNGQKIITYAALSDDINIMRERLKQEWHLTPEPSFALGDLILYSVLNEDTKLDELKFRALKQKMKNIVITQVLNEIFKEGVLASGMYSYYQPARDLFEKNTGKDLYLTMGIPVETQTIQIAIDQEKHKIFKASYLNGLNQPGIKTQIDNLIKTEESGLPKTVQYSDQEEGNEVEVETEMETEQEQEREEEKEDFSAFRDVVPHAVLPWNFTDFKPIPKHDNPIVSLKQALKTDKLNALSAAISENFLVSLNFAPLHHKDHLSKDLKTPYEFEFFGPYHKNLQDILLVQNKASGKFTCILIDDNDAKVWDEFLRTHPNSHSADKIALYNLSTHQIYRETANPIHAHDIPLELLVEASFLAGRVNYPQDQLDTLKSFLERSGAKAMLQVFKAEILHYKRDTQKAFRGSDLERVFIEILGSVD